LLEVTPTNYRVGPLELGVAHTLLMIDRATVPEMPDRIIAATAKHLGLALLTRDSAITASGVNVVW
jgi:predicted nucleic acid-binding protein